jgi:hypothetical protein
VAAEEVLSMITQRDVSQLGAKTLKTILEQGDANWISQEMIQAGTIFLGFVPLLLYDTWSVRLGAMVVVESLAEKKQELALKLCSPLIQAFDHSDIPVQGDILYALGETGNLETKRWVEKRIRNLENEDLKEAVQDAIDSITSRFPYNKKGFPASYCLWVTVKAWILCLAAWTTSPSWSFSTMDCNRVTSVVLSTNLIRTCGLE